MFKTILLTELVLHARMQADSQQNTIQITNRVYQIRQVINNLPTLSSFCRVGSVRRTVAL